MNVTKEFMILKDKYQYHRSELIIPKQERSYFSYLQMQPMRSVGMFKPYLISTRRPQIKPSCHNSLLKAARSILFGFFDTVQLQVNRYSIDFISVMVACNDTLAYMRQYRERLKLAVIKAKYA